MTTEQLALFEEIMDAVHKQIRGVFFLNAAGGTGKSFVLRALIRYVRALESLLASPSSKCPRSAVIRTPSYCPWGLVRVVPTRRLYAGFVR
jgi:hypothetical protein